MASRALMICLVVFGCYPSRDRRWGILYTDSASFGHDPPKGVYGGMIPCSKSRRTGSTLW